MYHNNDLKLVARNDLLEILTDEEIACVRTAEMINGLTAGDEYVDLGRIERGVQVCNEWTVVLGSVLPRSAVGATSWNKIVAQLAI